MPSQRAHLFERDNEMWFPQPASVGPWSPQALHGGPVAALCASVAEEALPGEGLVTTRLTLDLVRPVPLRPLHVNRQVIKEGRRVNLVAIEVRDEDRTVALAWVQRSLEAPFNLPSLEGTGCELVRPADGPESWPPLDSKLSPRGPAPFYEFATEMRVPDPVGIYGKRPIEAWIRVYADLLPGVPLSPAAAVMAAADYGNALGSPEAPGTYTAFPNADLTVYLARAPQEAWVRLSPETTWLADGLGHTRCRLADRYGMLGTSAVLLVLEPLAR